MLRGYYIRLAFGMFKEYRQRSLRKVINIADINKVLQMYILGKTIFLKHHHPIVEIKVFGYNANTNELDITTSHSLANICCCYIILEKYVEIRGIITHNLNQTYKLQVQEIYIADSERKDIRYKVNSNNIFISNFCINQSIVKLSSLNLPTSIKIYFNRLEQELKHTADSVVVSHFERLDDRFYLIQKTCKALFVSDTRDLNSYSIHDNDFIDYKLFLYNNDKVESMMRFYRQKGIVSELIVPIVYHDNSNIAYSIGYIHLISKTKTLNLKVYNEVQDSIKDCIHFINHSSMLQMNGSYTIINISNNGLQLKINDPETRKMIVGTSKIEFEINFRTTVSAYVKLYMNVIYEIQTEHSSFIGLEINKELSKDIIVKKYIKLLSTSLRFFNR